MKQPGEDKRLTDYLLGNLPESEEIRLEEEYLANSDAQDRLAAVEDDLVEAFLEGQLSARERKQLEARFLASRRGRRKLELAKSLMALASQQKPVPEPRPSPFYPLRWVFTTAALLLVFALGWWMSVKMRQSSTSERAASQSSGTNAQKGPVAAPTQTPVSTANPPENTRPTMIAYIVLSPVARNTDQSARLTIPQGARTVQIQLDLEADHHRSYRATLLGAGDEPKWSKRHLKAESTSSGRGVVLSLPATLFEQGEYTILLNTDEDATRTVAEYIFIVQKK